MLEQFVSQAKTAFARLSTSRKAKGAVVGLAMAGLSLLGGCVAVPYDGDRYYDNTVSYGSPVTYSGYNGYWINGYYYPAVRVYIDGKHHWRPSYSPIFHRHHDHAKPVRLHNGGPDWRDFYRHHDGRRDQDNRHDFRYDHRREPANDFRRIPPAPTHRPNLWENNRFEQRREPVSPAPTHRQEIDRQLDRDQDRQHRFLPPENTRQPDVRRTFPDRGQEQRREILQRQMEERREFHQQQQRDFRREAPPAVNRSPQVPPQQQVPQQQQPQPQGRPHHQRGEQQQQQQQQQGLFPQQGGPGGMR